MIKTAMRDISDKRWQGLTTCRQTKEMITGRCRRRERDLLALSRQMLRPAVGILTGHTQVQRHLSLMGLSNDPFCSYCIEAVESASHFLCHCNYFAVLRTTVWGKPSLHPTDIDSETVRDIVRLIKKSHRFPSSIQWQLADNPVMDPHWGLSLRGNATNALPLLEPGTWRPEIQ